MTTLELRKQALLMESELNRLTLCLEVKRLRETGADWAGRVAEARQRLTPWAIALAPLAGLLLARRLRRPSSKTARSRLLPTIWKLAPVLIRLWLAYKQTPADKAK